jgi:hypothetical protein
LTLRVDNLPETEKRQYENKGDANVTRRHGVDCTTIRREKICAVIFPPNDRRHAFRCGAPSEERLELSELLRKRTDCRIELPRLSLLHCKGPPSATPTSIGASAGVLQRQLPLSVF